MTNTGAISVTGGDTSSGLYAVVSTDAGDITLNNSGAITETTSGSGAYGIYAKSVGNVAITNSGVISAANTNTGSEYVTGIYGSADGTVTIGNTAAVTVNSSAEDTGYDIYATATGDATVTNSAALTATIPNSSAVGIENSTSGLATITNTGNITLTAGDSATGLYATSDSALITNSGQISAHSGSGAYGIYASTTNDTTISNLAAGTISAVSNASYSYGIYGHSSAGTVQIGNAASITSTAGSSASGIYAIFGGSNVVLANTGSVTVTADAGSAFGLYAAATNGSATVTNSSNVSATCTNTAVGLSPTYGIFAKTTTAGDIMVTNGGNVTATASTYSSNIVGVYANSAGNITIANSGSISGNDNNPDNDGGYGILAMAAGNIGITSTGSISSSGSGYNGNYGVKATGINLTINNQGIITVTGSGEYGATGISATSPSGTVAITNASTISSSSSYNAFAIAGNSGTGVLSITSTGAGHLTATSSGQVAFGIIGQGATVIVNNSSAITASGTYTVGIFAPAIGSGNITNSGAIDVTASQGAPGFGISSFTTAGDLSVANTGNITVLNSGQATGMNSDTSGTGSVTVTNGATLHVTSTNSAAYGIYASASDFAGPSTGDVTVTNSGTITVSGPGGEPLVDGIAAIATTGTVTVNNSGTITATSMDGIGSGGLGISVDPNGPIIVNNTGSSTGTTSGIYVGGAGTVNNSGLASGGQYSIYVLTGSTVNLNDASPIVGLLKGGSDDTSTSLLNFNLKVRGNVAAAKAELDAAIAQYNSDLAAMPKGPQDNVRSATVVLNGFDYQWEDFFGISDNLVQARLYADTPGFGAVGAAIDNFNPASVSAIAILAALDNLPDSAVAGALAQLSPQSLQVLRNIAFDNATFTAANVNNHLANLRDGLTGFDTSGFTVNTPGVDPSMAQMKSRLLAWSPPPFDHGLLSDSGSSLTGGMDMKDAKTMVNTQPVDRWSAFISGSVILANLDNTTTNIGDADYTTGSVMAGVDYRFGDHFTVGALFDYSHTSATLDGNGSKATVDSYAPGIYASYVDKGWYGNAMLMYGFENNTDDRNVTIPGISGTNHGAADGGQVTSNVTGGYEFQRGKFKYGPVATLQYVHLTVGSLQEQGPTSLSIDRQEADSLRSQLGFEARYSTESRTPLGLMTFTPHFQATWQHEYMDNSDDISSQFNGGAGGGSFIVQGRQPARDSAFLDLGIDAQVAKNVTIFIDYQTQAGESDFFAQSAQGGVRIGF